MLPFQKSCVIYREHGIVYTCTDPQVLDSTEIDNKIVSAKICYIRGLWKI